MRNSYTSPRLIPLALLCACAAIVLATVLADRGGAQDVRSKANVIGQTAKTPKPVCPTPNVDSPPADKACQVLGRVTGFQYMADGQKNPYKVRKAGKIVAWSVSLGEPNKDEQEFFETELQKSGPPSARLSILKPKGDPDENVYKLTKQTPVVQLSSWYGQPPVFTLNDPLNVKKGVIVAITTPTWAPNLGLRGASVSDRWRASRQAGECDGEVDLLEKSRPHQKVGGKREYGCSYKATRVLYTAFLSPKGN